MGAGHSRSRMDQADSHQSVVVVLGQDSVLVGPEDLPAVVACHVPGGVLVEGALGLGHLAQHCRP